MYKDVFQKLEEELKKIKEINSQENNDSFMFLVNDCRKRLEESRERIKHEENVLQSRLLEWIDYQYRIFFLDMENRG